jgi:glucokinase
MKPITSSVSPKPFVVGVDVGGTKIAAGVVDANGQVSGRVKVPTDTRQPEMTLQSIRGAITATLHEAGVSPSQISGVGLGIPGKVDTVNGISLLAVNLGWRAIPVKLRLEEALGLPCFIENDVSVAAQGESLYGAGKGLENFIYLSLGTGVAARMILNSQLYRGSNGLAGEIGHTIFVPSGPQCSCGARGCLEALVSGPALARLAQEEIQTGKSTILRDGQLHEPQLAAEHVFAAAIQGDNVAEQILARAGTHLAYAIYLLAMVFDPQAVVLGGGLAQTGGPFIAAIRSGVVSWLEQSPIFREILSTESLLLSSLKLDAGILGAAALVSTRLKTAESGDSDI